MVLIKENHVAMAGGVGAAVRAARAASPGRARSRSSAATEAEVDEALEAGAPRILLDNMAPGGDARDRRPRRRPRRARGQRRRSRSTTVRAVAETGVDFISVGALTHSAPALDLSLLLEPLP